MTKSLPVVTNINQLTHDFEIKITNSGDKYIKFWIYSAIPDFAFLDMLSMTFNNSNYYGPDNKTWYIEPGSNREVLTIKYLIKNDIIEWDDNNHTQFKLTRNFLLQML